MPGGTAGAAGDRIPSPARHPAANPSAVWLVRLGGDGR